MDEFIDQAWESLLEGVLKNNHPARPGIGDGIDLYVPQSRILSLAESNPDILQTLYYSARESSRRNAVRIMGKLGMPADYFWKFEYWPKARAFSTLEKIVARVFSSIMRYSKEGELKITGLEIDPLVINLSFANCVECAGMAGIEHAICYYHAGTLAGILSGLLNINLDGFEQECHALGADICYFTVADVSSNGLKSSFERYITPPQLSPDMKSRLLMSLHNQPVRSIGNVVNINYLQLALANLLVSDPAGYAADSYETGYELGARLAPVITAHYGDDFLKSLEAYYLQLGEFEVTITREESVFHLTIHECAEFTIRTKLPEMTAFLTGELCGFISSVIGARMTVVQSRFDGENLILAFTPEGQDEQGIEQ